MSEDYVEWDVHATNDALTPRVEYDDPLSQFSESEKQHPYYSPYVTAAVQDTPPLPPVIPSSSPIIDSMDSLPTSATPPTPTKSPFVPPKSKSVELSNAIEVVAMDIIISDPQKHQDATQGAFITYLITTNTQVENFSSSKPRPVRRRYQDFVWLHTTLSLEYPACIVPPLPEKHRLVCSGFWTEYQDIPYCKSHNAPVSFLNQLILYKNDKRSQVLNIPHTTSIIDSISDTLVNAFAKLKKPDERFEEMKEQISKLEDNLNTVEKLYFRINKRQLDLQNDYTNFANSIQGLSALETNITNSLYQFAETSKAYSKAMKDMTEVEEVQFLNEIHELLAYCHAAKVRYNWVGIASAVLTLCEQDVLKARDQKQLDFEELSVYLHQTVQLRDRTQHPGRKYNDRGMAAGGLYISDYVTDKLNEVRGVNMERARREKLSKLELRVKELQDEVTRANDDSNGFSNQVIKEFEVFQKTKTLELKQGLLAYADCHIEFYQKGTAIWEKVLPVLEGMDGVKGDGPAAN
ncbi:lipid binding protein [Mucor ambiguus]|uniref:Sorting nexin-4 n=1 Tax=Mucor ambiguus TaxID=91626 RepID=A0A0C9M826_9FUNG|nr:lipid binding protein [Mucor ambiguus]